MSQIVLLKNCNNFDEAKITIKLNTLNIKYGANGTGKSTIAKALSEYSKNKNIQSLIPFKHRSSETDTLDKKEPSISGVDTFKNIMMFNEVYVNSFLFKEDEIVSNSFEIFVKTPDYEKNMDQITKLLSTIEDTFKQKPEIDQVISDLTELLAAFGTSENTIAKSSKFHKSYGAGNKQENIPKSLQEYAPFIQSANPNAWIGWQIQGKNYIDEQHDACPYCVSPINHIKDTVLQVEKEYKPKDIEHLLSIQKIMASLGHYFSDDTKSQIDAITKNSSGLSEEQTSSLSTLRLQMNVLKNKLDNIKRTSFFSLKEKPKELNTAINGLKIDLQYIGHLNSQASQSIVGEINNALDVIVAKISNLQGQINMQNTHVQETIEKHKAEINDFLKFAGYRYEVDIVQKEQTYRMLFKHIDANEHLSNATQHLSYGERNAFSIVLFMYDCLANSPDLIILDDPISSFDKTKKYAIMQRLFTGQNTLKDKTVLMMTHDVEPIIDIVKVRELKSQFKPYNSFLSLENGKITEIEITSNDLQSFAQICKENIARDDVPDIIKAIYLRRHYEILDNKGIEYHMLASLLHLREVPTDHKGIELTPLEQLEGKKNIQNNSPGIQNFVYADLLSLLQDKKNMQQLYQETSNRYEKLQLFRLIHEQNKITPKAKLHESPVIRKHINEAFHIENELIIQLNPKKYDFVPEYVITECNSTLNITN